MSTGARGDETVDLHATPLEAGVSTAIAPIVDGLGSAADTAVGLDVERALAVGRYVIAQRVGVGGMGTVYKAYDPELDRGVAIKILNPSKDGPSSDGSERLLREAQAMAKLTHPHVVTVHDVGTIDRGGSPTVFVAMEFIGGGTLRQWAEAEPRPWRRTVDVYIRAGEGLAAAHRAGLVHRDFKPENVLMAERGPVVCDFGLARAIETPDGTPSHDELSSGRLVERLTLTGATMGTPAYMSPEQYGGDSADERTDQFAFAVALWEALYRQRPFEGRSIAALSYNVVRGRLVPPPTGHGVPSRIHDVIARALSTDPEDRFESMAALLALLRRRRRATWLHPAWFAAGGALGLGAAFAFGRAQEDDAPCVGAADELAGVWNDARRRELEEAFAATELPFAPKSAEGVGAQLDAYTVAWAAAQKDACVATRVIGAQSEAMLDRRTVCLARRRAVFQALIEILLDPDATVVRNAMQGVEGLPSVEQCSDVVALASRGDLLVAEGVQGTVEDAFESLARLQAMRFAMRTEDWDVAAEAFRTQFAELDVPAVQGAFALESAAMHQRMRRFPEAIDATEEALLYAEAAADDVRRLKASATMMQLHGYWLGDPAAGKRWQRRTEATLARLGNPPLRVARLDRAMAMLLYRRGDYAQALVRSDAAIEAIQRLAPHKLDLLGNIMSNRASILSAMHRGAEAAEAHEKVLQLRLRALGPAHPDVGMTYNNLGSANLNAARFERATEFLNKALEVWEASLPPEHPDLGLAHNNLGNAAGQLHKLDEAAAHLRRAVEIWSKAHGVDHINVRTAQQNLARVYFLQGKYELSYELSVEVLESQRRQLGDQHTDLVYGLVNVADAARELGKHDVAVDNAAQARTLGDDSRGAGDFLSLLGLRAEIAARLARKREGDIAQAAALAKVAVEAVDRKDAPPADERGALAFAAARALHATDGDPSVVLRLLEVAKHDTASDLRDRVAAFEAALTD